MSEVQQIILPEGFKRVQYLQSTGNEVIYTGIIPTDKHGFYAEIESLGGTTGYACGTQSMGGSPGFWIYVSNGVLQASYENNTKTTVSANSKVTIKNNFLNDRKLVSDKSVVKNYSQDFTYNWSYEFTVFKSTYTANTKFDPVAPIRIYRFKISENEKIIRDFVPCLDVNDTPCMYDILGTGTIEENTYYNQGEGQFYYPRNHPSSNYNLPAGFKKCVYLQSDGTQWIDTGVVPNNETGLFCKTIKFDNSNSSMFGVRENGSTAIMTPYVGGKTISYRWKAEGKDNIYTLDKAGDYIFSSFINFYNDRVARIDSEDTDWATPLSGILENYTRNIWLFSTNFQGTFNNTYGKYVGRVYRAQITQGDALIHDYVPCLDANGRPCMYDIIGGGTVEDNTYYNQSGGTEFTYCVEHQLPSDFVKLKYLESTGTQYIKTGYVPTNTTGLYIDTQDVGSGDTIPMGLRESSSTNTRFFITRQTTSHSAGYGWGAWTAISTTTGSVRYDSTLNWLNDRKSITNNPLFSQIVKSLSDLSFTPTCSIYMFGVNQANVHSYNFKGRIYRAKISEGTEIVRDFVPALDQRISKPCMYDLINNVAYYNDGEGEFLTNRDFEGTYKGFTGLGCIGNRLGTIIDNGVPLGYTRVDFLEANERQYIDTKVIPTGDLKITVDVMATKWVYVNYVFGSAQRAGGQVAFSLDYNNAHNRAGLYRYGSQSSYFPYGTHKLNTRYHYVFDKNVVYRDGKEVSLLGGTKFNYETFTGSQYNPILLFISRHDNLNFYNEGTKRIWNFSIENGEGQVINFIPAIDTDGKPCMFDTVSKKPFYNVGSGQFVVGLKSIYHGLSLNLPNTGGAITLSLPTNDKIEYYEEKIRNNNPNWTITFQYH